MKGNVSVSSFVAKELKLMWLNTGKKKTLAHPRNLILKNVLQVEEGAECCASVSSSLQKMFQE